MSSDETTRERILGLIASAGPVTASLLADELCVTPAGVRRHLTHLTEDGLIEEHEQPGKHDRGRGRPARSYVATPEGQRALTNAYSDVATDALAHLRSAGALDSFIEAQLARLEADLAAVVDPTAPVAARVDAIAAALGDKGYATSVRPVPGGYAVQLCQGHCPVQRIAESAPEWCEAETRALSRVLDLHVQRLSTLANGAHVCTTNIPLMAGTKEGTS